MFKDEKRAFDALDKELRSMNTPDPEDDLADIYALLDKDYTNPAEEPREQEPPAPRMPEMKAAGHESRETRELLQDEEPTPAKKRSSVIPLAILAVLELAAIAAVVVWWLQWLR